MAQNEGDMQVAVKPYQIPYRVMFPKRAEAEQSTGAGLHCRRATWHILVRMEPQYMILGQAAGVARQTGDIGRHMGAGNSRQDVVDRLKMRGAVLEYVPSAQAPAMELFRKRMSGK